MGVLQRVRRRGLATLHVGLTLLVLGLAAPPAHAGLSSTPADTAVTNGSVNAILPAGPITYIAGNFDQVGPRTGGGVGLDSATASRQTWPQVDGQVFAVVADGTGGWYLGGDFAAVGGVAVKNLAHVRADKTVDAAFAPNPSFWVTAIAVDGSTVYAGGSFSSIGGQPRNNIAALNAADGTATAWNPGASSTVYDLVVSGSGSAATVYAGGSFTTIGGQPRNKIAALSAANGTATAWNPNATGSGASVFTLAIDGSRIYAGGIFTGIGGQSRNNVAALDASTGAADTTWNPNAGDQVSDLAISGSGSTATIYAGGSFGTIGGQSRSRIAALSATDGTATAWNPGVTGEYVSAIAVSGATVYAGGEFTSIGGQSRNRLAALNVSDGQATGWNPNVNASVSAIAASGTTVFAGGAFTSIGSVKRSKIAAIDNATGAPTAWDPGEISGGAVFALQRAGDTLYAGGAFTSIAGQTRHRLAALDTGSGSLVSGWDPDVSGTVNALALSGAGTLYVGGSYTTIDSAEHLRLSEVTLADGVATSWAPNPSNAVFSLAVSGAGPDKLVYVGGWFASLGGQPRNNIGAVKASDGTATSFNPNVNDYVFALAVAGTGPSATVYAGGKFTRANGTTTVRNRLAAFNASDGTLTDWNPGTSSPNVRALALSPLGSTIYVGGDFFSAGVGQPRRNYAAEINLSDGTATAWNPNASNEVLALGVSGSSVLVGGRFLKIDGKPQSNFARFDDTGSTTRSLTVGFSGSGSGSVSSSPAGIACPSTCNAAMADGQTVTLTATSATGSTFAGWTGGGCSGTGTCTVTLNSDTLVSAQFNATGGGPVGGGGSTGGGTGGGAGVGGSLGGASVPAGPTGTPALTEAQLFLAANRFFNLASSTNSVKKARQYGSFKASGPAVSSGDNVKLDFYYLPKGAKVSKKAKPVLVASGSATAKKAGPLTITAKLTGKGRTLLKKQKSALKLTGKVTYRHKGSKAVTRTKVLRVRK